METIRDNNACKRESEFITKVLLRGYDTIVESLSTDDANAIMVGNNVIHTGLGQGLEQATAHKGFDINEFFSGDDNLDPIDDEKLDIIKKSQMGVGVQPRKHLTGDRMSSTNDPLSSGHSVIGTTGGGDGAYAGSSGGYNLGGP